MKTAISISKELEAIIPMYQFLATMEAPEEHAEALQRLQMQLDKCPKIHETEKLKEHPAIFHYFYGGSDFYICEYDPDDGLMFGYGILGGDLPNSEWGYFSTLEFSKSKYTNIDYHFEEQSIEAALYSAYPDYFKKPSSLQENITIDKNDPLPETYRAFPYQYTKLNLGTVLRKNNDEVYLFGDDETQFFRDCNRAKQKGRSISDVINDYF